MSTVAFADADAKRQHQLEAIRTLLATILPSNRFYARKLAGIEQIESLEAFAESVPFTVKSDLVSDQRDHPPYGHNLTHPLDQYSRFNQTSATTGTPLRCLDTAESWAWMLSNWQRVYEAAGVTAYDRIFFAFSFGPFLGFWTAFEAAMGMGCLCLPGGGMSSVSRAQLIVDNAATILCCTPTYAIHLAESAHAAGVPLEQHRLRRIIVAGEPGGSIPATRARIETLWPGAKVMDHHGMTEVGPVSYECPVHTGSLHVIETAYYPEIIDPESGKAVQAGNRGELVLTTLGRAAAPLIRYRSGDLVTAADETRCACGSLDLRLVGGILSRADDMVIVRGVNVYPAAIEDVIRQHVDVAEYQVRLWSQGEMSEMDVLAEPTADCKDHDTLATRLGRALQTAFNLRIPVRLAESGSLPRYEMKAKRWLRLNRAPDDGGAVK